jgi:5-(carboxyamino)imidazole ribonucleotide mutase
LPIANPQSEIYNPRQTKTFYSSYWERAMTSQKPVLVAVVMGSDSDLGVMNNCVEQLRRFGIEAGVRILSAHRTPQAAAQFAESAEDEGIKVIIAAAGMAAHLAGALAARTTLPVIGVPLVADPALGGTDALLSTVQMPPGVPVATMALGKAGAKNAAIFAVQILALSDPDLRRKLADFRKEQEQAVRQKDASLQG